MHSPSTSRNRVGLLMTTLLVASLFACGPQQPSSPEADTTQSTAGSSKPLAAVVRVTVPQGTELQATLSTAVGSETSQVGDQLTATTTAAVVVGNQVAIPAGSTIHGAVTEVYPTTKGLKVSEKGGAVVLSFNAMTTPQGVNSPMSASLSRFAKSGGKTAAIIGGSAAGGALLGKILGGSNQDIAAGAVVGGGIGTGIAAGTKGKALMIPAGTDLTLTLDQPLTLADRS